MTSPSESLTAKTEVGKKNHLWLRWVKYLLLGAICNGAVWSLAISYLKNTPVSYTSKLVLHIAGSAPGVSVNLPSIGQANTSSGSAFGAHSDPRENYKLMAMSSSVIKNAAAALDMSESEYGVPGVDIINNTTFLTVETSSQQPKISQEKAWAFYQAFYQRLNVLRAEEQSERDKSVQQILIDTKSKLTEAQKELSNYKSASGLSSADQITNLIGNIGDLQTKLINTIALYQKTNARLQELSTTLRLSPQKAADALVLQTDQEFQNVLKEYTNTTTQLVTLRANRGPNYPDVIEARQKQQATLKTLLQRGEKLLNIPIEQLSLERLILDNQNGSGVKRGDLFVQLVTMHGEVKGLAQEIKTLKEQIAELDTKLGILTAKESVLDNLDRNLQIAQAVFASTLTKIDLSKGDLFASFPMIQIIEEPSLPEKPSAPKPKLVYVGALFGSILVSAGLTLLWWREPLLKISQRIVQKVME